MIKPLIVVDFEPKGKVFLDYFNQQAEVITVQSPPVRCTYTEIEDGGSVPRLQFSFTPLPAHTKFIEAVNEDREIIIAFDNDIIGDYLGWLIQSYLKNQKGSLENVQYLDISCYSKRGIDKALAKAGSNDLEEKQEFYIRSLFDQGLGAHLQRLIGSRVGPGNRPLTYASLTTIFLLEESDKAAKMRSASKRWQIMVECGCAHGDFKARLEKAPGVKSNGLIKDVSQGKEVVAYIQEQETFEVRKIERQELTIDSPLPYVLPEILNDARILYGYQPRKTVEIIKKLSAGMEIQGRCQGLVSTLSASKEDCVDVLTSLQKKVARLFGEDNRGSIPEEVEAGMLLPLVAEIESDVLATVLDADSLKIYELIHGRALASLMKEAVGESVSLQVAAADIVLDAQFNSIAQQGFLSAHRCFYDVDMFEPCPFADLQEGQKITCKAVVPQQAEKAMGENYTLATLFAELADFSVAAEPYNVFMLQGLMEHGYVTLDPAGTLVAGPNTGRVASLLKRAFPKMSGINLSAYIEQTVNEVLTGRKGLDFALKQFGQTLMLQGKKLVTFKRPAKGVLLKRPSRTIIKQDAQAAVSEMKKPSESESMGSEPGEEGSSGQYDVNDEAEKSIMPSQLEGDVSDPDVSVEQSSDEEDQGANRSAGHSLEKEESYLDVQKEQKDRVLVEGAEEEEACEAEKMSIESSHVERKENISDEFADEFIEDVVDAHDLMDQKSESLHFEGEDVETDQKKICPVCAKVMILRKDKFGKFWNCKGFPACRHSEAFKAEQGSVKTCPLCRESDLVIKKTPTGKAFHVCMDPDCEFMAWSEPYHLPCQVCGSSYLVEKKTAKGTTYLRCPKAGCNYMQALPGESGKDLFNETPQKVDAGPKKVRVVRRKKSGAAAGTKKVRVVRRKK